MRHLLRRVCEITTIVFPQQVLPLTRIYEPLIVREKYNATKRKRAEVFSVNTIKTGNNYLIVDSAGMGKSTFAKHLVLEIFKLTPKIPIFLELRRINESESLLGKIAREIDASQKDIDEKLLLMLLDQGGYVIILDGFDELPDRLRENIGQQITELAVRCETNSLILTSRPEVYLPDIPASKTYTINPLTNKQAKSLVLRYDEVAKIDVGKRLINQFDKVSERFLQTPLLVVLLYRTYGFNQSIATRITSFYDDIYNAMYKGHDLSKAGFSRNKTSQLDSEDFRRLLRGFSFLLMVRQKDDLKNKSEAITIIEEAIKLTSIKPSTPDSFLDDLLLAVPLLIKDGTDYRFIHRSIGEFFSAEYLATSPNPEKSIENIRDGYLYSSFINSLQYLSDINPSLFRRMIVAPLARRVLSEKDPIRDSSVRTLSFLGQTQVALFQYHQNYGKKEEDDILPHFNIKREHDARYMVIDGSLGKKRYLFAVKENNKKILPYTAWQLITREVKSDKPQFDQDFDGLDKFLEDGQWVSLDDDKILNNVNHPIIRFIIYHLLLKQNHATFNDYDRTSERPRILDENSCKTILQQIQQELETQNWLEVLITKK